MTKWNIIFLIIPNLVYIYRFFLLYSNFAIVIVTKLIHHTKSLFNMKNQIIQKQNERKPRLRFIVNRAA